MAEYLVVSRAQAGIRFGKAEPLILHQFPTQVGPADILIQTRFVPYQSVSRPVPTGLMAQVRGVAPSLDEALQEFSRVVQSLCPVFVLLGNSPIEDMIPEIGFDVSPGITEREYFQQFLPEEPLLVVERRRLSSDLVLRVLRALHSHSEVDRLRRAMGQYYQALRNWEPGQEVLALAHLWMGMEAITPVRLRRLLTSQELGRRDLAGAWEVEERHLEAEVRKRLLMRGDAEAYKKAKAASDGFEHGFLGFAEVHAYSDTVRVQVATDLRQAIIEEIGIETADVATINTAPYETPGHLRVAKYLRGTLISESSEMAAQTQAYPYLEWRTRFEEVETDSSDDITFSIKEEITPRIAEGVRFRPKSIEAWAGQKSTLKIHGV